MELFRPPPLKNPHGPQYIKPKTPNDYLIKEFDYPSGKVYIISAGLMDLDAYLFNEFEEGKDYQYRDGRIFIKEQAWTALLLRWS